MIVVSADAFGSQTADRFRVVGTFHVGSDELDGYGALVDLARAAGLPRGGRGLSRTSRSSRATRRALPALDARLRRGVSRRPLRGAWPGPSSCPTWSQFIKLDDVGDWMQNALLLIVVAFGLLEHVLMSVFERVREFGVLRALGLRPRAVFGLVVLESLLLSLLGIALGLRDRHSARAVARAITRSRSSSRRCARRSRCSGSSR